MACCNDGADSRTPAAVVAEVDARGAMDKVAEVEAVAAAAAVVAAAAPVAAQRRRRWWRRRRGLHRQVKRRYVMLRYVAALSVVQPTVADAEEEAEGRGIGMAAMLVVATVLAVVVLVVHDVRQWGLAVVMGLVAVVAAVVEVERVVVACGAACGAAFLRKISRVGVYSGTGITLI